MNVRECKQTVTLLLDALEGRVELTEKQKSEYGYRSDYYGSKNYYDRYRVKEKIALVRSDRSQVTKTMLKDMKKFLEKAEKMGFRGRVEFRNGYDQGMYASTRDFTNQEEREGQIVLYHSFETGSNYWKLLNDKKNKINETCYTETDIKKLVKDYAEGRV